jgi:hypothetical protein
MKNLRAFYIYIILAACSPSTSPSGSPEWLDLFNGKDLTGWQPKISGYELNENYANTFRVHEGVLKVSYDGYDEFDNKFGHVFFKDKFSSYLFRLEYRFTGDQVKGGPGWAIRNSGVMLHCQDPKTMWKDQDFPISLETQLLGGNGKDERTTANLCTPGTNVVIDGKFVTDHCINSTSKTYHNDQWVTLNILVLGDSLVEHIMEGKTVFRYNKPQSGGGAVANYDTTLLKDGTPLTEGYISLQSESHPVEFRKVQILDLSAYRNDPARLRTLIERELKIEN